MPFGFSGNGCNKLGPDATAKSVHVGRVPVKAAGSRDATCRVRLSGVRTAAAGA
jgi:hypothetical protein